MKLSFNSLALGIALCASTSVFAAGATATQSVTTKPVMDKDAPLVHLDIARELSDTTSGNPCGVEQAKLLYLNHQGVEHELDYRIAGECPAQN